MHARRQELVLLCKSRSNPRRSQLETLHPQPMVKVPTFRERQIRLRQAVAKSVVKKPVALEAKLGKVSVISLVRVKQTVKLNKKVQRAKKLAARVINQPQVMNRAMKIVPQESLRNNARELPNLVKLNKPSKQVQLDKLAKIRRQVSHRMVVIPWR